MIEILVSQIPPNPNYIDPGTGSLLIQIVIAGLVAGMIFLRNYLRKFIAFCMRWRKK